MKCEKYLVLKISGSIVSPKNRGLIREYSKVIRRLVTRGYKLAVVVGGGDVAKEYIGAARDCGVEEGWLDILGIEASRLNALLLISTLRDNAYPYPPRSLEEFLKAWSTSSIVVCGGFQPGQSTNAVSAIIAESIGATTIVNASRIDAIYDKDPKTHPEAKPFKEITVSQLRRMLSRSREKPGEYDVLDDLSLNVLERSKIKLIFLDGKKPELITEALKGVIRGTLVKPE